MPGGTELDGPRAAGTVSSGRRGTPVPAVVRAAGGIAAALALGTAVLAVGHAGIVVPGVSALGPGGDRPVWPAAAAFTVATLGYVAVAWGLRRGRRRTVPAALALFGLTFVAALVPFRGAGSVVGAALAAAGAGLLLSPVARRWMAARDG